MDCKVVNKDQKVRFPQVKDWSAKARCAASPVVRRYAEKYIYASASSHVSEGSLATVGEKRFIVHSLATMDNP